MSFYVLTDGENSYIRQDKSSNKYVTVRGLKYAKTFENFQKAESVLNNSISKPIRNKYKVIMVDSESITNKNTDKIKEIGSRDIEYDNIEDLTKHIESLMEILSTSESKKKDLLSKLSVVDKEIVDIQHYIEFGKFNCYLS